MESNHRLPAVLSFQQALPLATPDELPPFVSLAPFCVAAFIKSGCGRPLQPGTLWFG